MEKKVQLTSEALESVIGGNLDSDVMEYLDNVIRRAKQASKTLEQCVSDFYKYNQYFNQEQEEYIRLHWDYVQA